MRGGMDALEGLISYNFIMQQVYYIEKQKYWHKNIKDIERGNYYLERR
jgi:hypothetical protein